MKYYFILIILLLAKTIAFCQYRHKNTKALDTTSQLKLAHRIYKFDGILRKPWTFYSLNNRELKALPDSEQISRKTKHWEKYILTIRDITVDCVGDFANMTIIYNRDKFRYVLKRSAPSKYTFNKGPVSLMLIIKSPLICEFYFIEEHEAASVSNMDWELAN